MFRSTVVGHILIVPFTLGVFVFALSLFNATLPGNDPFLFGRYALESALFTTACMLIVSLAAIVEAARGPRRKR